MLSVFGLFTFEQPRWTVEQAAEELGLAQSTTYRYFRKLSDAGLIVAISTGQYVLGPTITMLDRQMRMLDPLITSADTLMQRLAPTIEIPSVLFVCRLYRNQVMCIYTHDVGKPGFAYSYERGRPMPLHRGAASKVIMAHLPARVVRPLIEQNQKDVTAAGLGSTWPITKKRLRLIRNAGVLVTRGDLDRGLLGIASPIFGKDGGVIGSFCIVMKDDKSAEQQLDTLTEKIVSASRVITA
ncbi:IclR family transcriptional regulator [Pseudorhodoplanes sinuspersici]|uniref:Uncharacterized protein n=1 Tax=Pseudorhodoplanes sinuspersici TaxID=1235591 RepID=A0A1W6ZT72_9HYPH|nr:IclR family transcriptional regulator C-terminal domain-containing protein [Pseudorhodoplanes sinuspersici]ARQ00552.1 hypothetical protein CAK95_16820 [Pseudorhodoplanes sinuspersici]RKE72144.1 IclR family transcriptional regulator [Pseudorhodoplanes sinuspersici]